MTQAYVRAESQVACFLRRLLHKYPASVRDVNPAIQSDDEFSKLESARLGAIASEKCNLDLLNIIENRQFSRSVMLIEDDTYVKLAQDEYLGLESELQKLCSTKPFSSAAGASLCVTRDIAYYNFRLLKARHARRRIAEVPLFPVDDEKLFSLTDEYVAIPTKVVESRVRNDPFSLFLKQNERAVKDSTLAAHTLRLRSTAEVRRQQIAEEEVKMQRVSKRRENAATRKYPMLRTFFESLSRNKIDLNDDKETLRLLSEREALLVPSASLLQSYPHIGRSLDLVRAGNSDLDDKTLLTTLAKEDDDLRQPIEEVLHSVNLKEKQMEERCSQLISAVSAEEACLREEMPFLAFLESAVPLRDLHLLENPTFTELFARYSGLRNGGGPAADAELKQLERAMCSLASRLAEDEAIARRRRLLEAENLHERYPYVPEEPVPGITLVEVGVLRDAAFCALSNELELLRVNPVANAGRAAAVEEALRTRVVELASARLSAAEKVCESNPFLGMRVDGLLVDELRLNENPEFQELVTRRAAVLAAPDADLEAVAGLENELRRCARAAAVEAKAINALRTDEDEAVRARNPFLEYNEVLTVPLRFLDFEDDGRVKLLKHRRLHYLVVGDNNARLLVEQRLSERVRDIARALYEGENELRNEFITRDSSAEFCNVHLSGLAIEEDEAVAKCMKEANLLRSDESILDPIELEKKEDETRKRILEMTQAYVRAESQIACFLRRLLHKYPASVRDVNPAIQSDDEFSKLESARLGAIASEKCNLDLLNIIENRQFSRSVMLIEDDTYVKLAQDEYLGLEGELQKLCSTKPFSSAAGASLCVTRDIAYYNFRLLKARHARRRIAEVPLFPVDDEKLFSLTDEYVAIPTKVVESRVRNDPFSLFLKQNERAVKDSTLAAHTLRLRSTAEVRRQQIAEEEVKMQRVSKRRENAATRKYPMLRTFFESLSRNKIDLNDDKETLRLLSEREALLVPSASLLQSYPHIGR
ncbi:unnamed protein product, partial [Trypanosoma congolense IL3000]